MPNPKTIAYQEMMKEFDKGFPLDFWATENCFSNPTELEFIQWQDSQTKRANLHIERMKSFIRSSYLYQLEEEVKRLRNKEKDENTWYCCKKCCSALGCTDVVCWCHSGFNDHIKSQKAPFPFRENQAIKSEIALCEEAIKEIKTLQ